ncbi:hypothetical protein O5D80_001182 [Batrachochytrium dendrobatidis]|nr:hypothetical protein O5D80_001182 [Batrachochytrium dendrobatidis]
MSLFTPANRKVKFHCRCTIHELSNLPYVSGLYFAKWKLTSGSAAKGSTQRSTVKDHQVVWNNEFEFEVTLIIGKEDMMLQSSDLRISVKQEIVGTRNTEKVGIVLLNLAEAAGQKTLSRKILLQETKLNSILRVTLHMELIKGDSSTFHTPTVKSRTGLESPLDAVRGETLERRITQEPGVFPVETESTSVLQRLSTIGSSEHAEVIDQIFANANRA